VTGAMSKRFVGRQGRQRPEVKESTVAGPWGTGSLGWFPRHATRLQKNNRWKGVSKKQRKQIVNRMGKGVGKKVGQIRWEVGEKEQRRREGERGNVQMEKTPAGPMKRKRGMEPGSP